MIIDLEDFLKRHSVYFELYEHAPLYTNEDAVKMKEEKGFTGTETKALFLEGKSGHYYSFITFTTKNADFKRLKQVVGEKVSIMKPDEMEKLTGQQVGAVIPLGYEKDVAMIVDEELFEQEKLVFAPARPDRTMVILAKDLKKSLVYWETRCLFMRNTKEE